MDEEEEIEEYDPQDKLNQLMDDLTDYCSHANIPLFKHPKTMEIIKERLEI